MLYLWTSQLAAFQLLFSNVRSCFFLQLKRFSVLPKHAERTSWSVNVRLHLPAPLWVASLGSWPVTDNAGAPSRHWKVANVWSWPRWVDLYSIQRDFVQLEWKLRQLFGRSCRTWPCWKIITRVGTAHGGSRCFSELCVSARRVEKKMQRDSWKSCLLEQTSMYLIYQLWLAHAALTTSITSPFSVCNLYIV